jgi:hypothetical protein
MRTGLTTLAVLSLALALPSRVAAWHNDGHMAVARIAWNQLTDKQKTSLSKLLKAHPHYEVYLAADRPEGVPEPEWAFVRAATWSDWVRDPFGAGLSQEDRKAIKEQFNKPVWHYVNLPFIHPNDAKKFDAAAIRKAILSPELDEKGEPRHVLAALKQCMKRLQDADTSDKDRAVYLCWLFHLVGDLHQPLHATALIASSDTFDPPFEPLHGDLGGNRLAIKVKADDPSAMNLHFYWDALLFSDQPPFPQVDARVTAWLKDKKYQRDQLPELKATEFLAWAEESLELAKTVVYQGEGGFLKAYALPANKKTSLKGLDAPVLPKGYQETAEKVAQRRMVVAGYRIADQLRQVLKAAE